MYFGIKARNLRIVLQILHPKPHMVKFKQIHALCSCAAQRDIVLKIFHVLMWVFTVSLHAPVCSRSAELVEIIEQCWEKPIQERDASKAFGLCLAASMPYAILFINFFLLSFPLHRPYKPIVEGFCLFVSRLGYYPIMHQVIYFQ